MKVATLDRVGITLSGLCLVHCLLLPILASTLPLMGLLADNENIHKLLVIGAIFPAALAFAKPLNLKYSPLIRIMAFFGVGMLCVGAFVEALHDHETMLTIIGALNLGFAHILKSFTAKPHIHTN